MSGSKREFTRRSDRIEELVSRIENTGDPAIRAVAQELVQAVIELHGAALDRIMAAIAELSDGDAILERMASDPLVSNVLSLHGLHPVPLEKRVAEALEKSQRYLNSHGGSVELVGVEDGAVHVRLEGTCGSCSSSTETLKGTVEAAIYEAAPEVAAVISESAPTPIGSSEFIILQSN